MPFISGDLGFSGLVLLLLSFIAPSFAVFFVVRRKWSVAAARKEEIRRLVFLASEEASRVELEAAAHYGGGSTTGRQQCAVCYCPTTTRCSRCKAVRYCSGKCQIIHWRQGHREECHPQAITNQYNGAVSDSDLKSALLAEPSDFKDNSLEIDGGWHAKPTEEFAEGPASSRSSCSSKVLCEEDGIEAKPPVDTSGIDFSRVSSVTEFSTVVAHTDPLVGVSVNEAHISSIPVRLDTPLSDDISHDTLSISSAVNVTSHSKSLPSEFCGPTHPVNSIPFPSKVKLKTPSHSTSKVDGSSSSSSSIINSSDERAISEQSTSRSEQCAGHDSSTRSRQAGDAIQSASGSIFRFSFNLSDQQVSSAHADNSSLKNCISDDTSRLVSGNAMPSYGAAPLKKLPTDVTASNSTPALSSERLSSVAKGRSHEKLPKPTALRSLSSGASDDHTSSNGGQPVSNITSSKVDSAHTMHTSQTETASSVLNGSNGLKTSMRKVVQQFRPSKLSKHHPLGMGSDISVKYNYKMLFPYDQFIKLYNWDKVSLRPCGLMNCGNSCYANAVLQCLAFTRPLTAYLLQGLHSKTCLKNEWCFTCELESLVLRAKEGKSSVSPIGILSQIKNIGSHLGHGREEDAHEFLRYAVDTMQSVCLKEAGVDVVDPLAEETTLIQLIFGGYLRSKIKCMKCQGKSERHERMMDLTVEIHGDIATLEEALTKFTATEILDGDNKYRCCRCKSYERAKKKLTVLEAPNVLTVALKRFQSGKFGKLNKSVRFPEILNLAPYMSGTSDKSPVYGLYAVVVHLDIMNAAFSGHYVCYVKNMEGKWFKIDDSVVRPVELDTVLSKGAYMLFYARCSPRAPSFIRNVTSHDNVKSRSKCTEAISSCHGGKNIPKARSSSSSLYSGPSAALQRPEDYPYRMGLEGPTNSSFGLFNQRILQRHRIPKADSSSDSSSLFSCSDEGSCNTESTRDSTSTDDYSEYIFGDSGRFSWNGSLKSWEDSDGFSSPMCSRPLPVSNGYMSSSPEHGYSAFSLSSSSLDNVHKGRDYAMDSEEVNGVDIRWPEAQIKREDVLLSKESPPFSYSDTAKQHRKLTKNSSSSSETDWELLGRVSPSDLRSGVSLRRCRKELLKTFYR